MDRQRFLHDFMEEELERYKQLQRKMIFQQKRLPKGSLSSRNDRLIYRTRENGKQYSITLSDEDVLISEVRKSRYIKEGLPIINKRIRECERYLKNDIYYDPCHIEAELNDCYHGLVDLGVFLQHDFLAEDWSKINVIKNPAPFKQEHYTDNKVKCRSKSEAMIGSNLEKRGILYWYDTAVKLYDGSVVYADFKIYLPKRRRLVILEHLGLMEKPKYAINNTRRLDKYSRSGFYLGLNLFISYETAAHPLNAYDIDWKIEEILEHDKL